MRTIRTCRDGANTWPESLRLLYSVYYNKQECFNVFDATLKRIGSLRVPLNFWVRCTCHTTELMWLNYDIRLIGLNYKVKLSIIPHLLYMMIPNQSHSLQHVKTIKQENQKPKWRKISLCMLPQTDKDKQQQKWQVLPHTRLNPGFSMYTDTITRLGITQQTSEGGSIQTK